MPRPSLAVLLLALLAVAPAVHAAPAADKAPKPRVAKVKDEAPTAAMASFLVHLRGLQPYLSSRGAFSDPANEAVVRALLKGLVDTSNGLDHVGALKATGFAISGRVFKDHVARTARIFENGPREYARAMARATLEGCISCHSQLPAGAGRFVLEPGTLEGRPLDKADLLFATRNFDAAVAGYDQLLDSLPAGEGVDLAVVRADAETALRRKLAIELRVKRDVKGATAMVTRDLARANLPAALQPMLLAWKAELEAPGLAPAFDPAKAKAATVLGWARRAVGDDKDPTSMFERPGEAARYLVVSGVLYEFVARNKAAKAPNDALRLLARADRALSGDFFFSLADLYLEECVRRAPASAEGKRCLDDLRSSITFQFTGSGGTSIPADVQARLDELAALRHGGSRR